MSRDYIESFQFNTLGELIKVLEALKEKYGDIELRQSEYPGSRSEIGFDSGRVVHYSECDESCFYILF